MAAISDASLTITICEEDRKLLRKIIQLLEMLDESNGFKSLVKEVIDQYQDSGRKHPNRDYFD